MRNKFGSLPVSPALALIAVAAVAYTQYSPSYRVSAANSEEISIYFNKYLFGQNKYFLAYF